MTQERDNMHAAGGAFMAAAMARENEAAATKQKAVRTNMATLTQAENYKLVNWLHTRTPVWGETVNDITAAASVLNIPRLNREHIRNRLSEHDETLPKASPPVRELTVHERLENAEKALAIIAKHLTVSEATPPELAFLADYYNTNQQGVV
jgi:hypothetical protein